MPCQECNGTKWVLGNGEWWYCEQCLGKAVPAPPAPDCTCATCNNTGWIGTTHNYVTTYSVCTTCNNKCKFDKPHDEIDCSCNECNGLGWVNDVPEDEDAEEGNWLILWVQCPVCNNRCDQDMPPIAQAAGFKISKRRTKISKRRTKISKRRLKRPKIRKPNRA